VRYQTPFHLMVVITSAFLCREGSDLGWLKQVPRFAQDDK
jgi:hypothetical protein